MKRIVCGASALVVSVALVSMPAWAAQPKPKHIKLTGIDTGKLGRTKELGTGLKHPPSCGFPKTITVKKGKQRAGTLHFTKCMSNGGTGFIYIGHATLKVGRYRNLPHMRVAYGPFSPNGSGTVSTASFKSESLLIKGSLPTKRGAKVKIVLTT